MYNFIKILHFVFRSFNKNFFEIYFNRLEIGAFDDVDGQCLVELHEIKIKVILN